MSKAMLKLNFIEITKTLTIQFDLEKMAEEISQTQQILVLKKCFWEH